MKYTRIVTREQQAQQTYLAAVISARKLKDFKTHVEIIATGLTLERNGDVVPGDLNTYSLRSLLTQKLRAELRDAMTELLDDLWPEPEPRRAPRRPVAR